MKKTKCKSSQEEPSVQVPECIVRSLSLHSHFYFIFVFLAPGDNRGTEETVSEELNSFHIVICAKSGKE